MTIRYLDLEDGSDAADGLAFANRKKTWFSASTGLAAGDEIRLIASPDPASIGAVTWTDNSRTFGLPAGLVKVVDDGVAGWVVSTNVTLATGTSRKVTTGASSQTFSALSAFTTGKIAFKTLPAPLDLSAFQALSFWLLTNVAAPLGSLELRLCSDTLGDVAVASVPLDDGVQPTAASPWAVMLKDFGGALPASVQSVAIYAPTDPGAVIVRINNLIACKGKNDPQHLSHVSLIGKNTVQEPEWYSLQAFTDTTALTASVRAIDESSAVKARPYRGTTETVDTFALRPLIIQSSDTNRALQVAGTAALPCKITGGWNRADMSTQTGVSWITGRYRYSDILNGNQKSYWSVEKIGIAHVGGGSGILGAWNGWNQQLEGYISVDNPFYENAAMSFDAVLTLSCKQIWGSGAVFNWPINSIPTKYSIGRIHGGAFTGSAAYTNNSAPPTRHTGQVGKIDNNAGYGFSPGTSPSRALLCGTVLANNDQGDLFAQSTDLEATVHNCTLLSTIKYVNNIARTAGALVISAEGGDPSKHTVVKKHSVLTTDSAVRHGASGVAWKLTLLTPATASSPDLPISFKLGDVAVKAGIPVTVKCWMQRDSALLSAGLQVEDGWLAGVTETRAAAAAAAGAWEQVTLTFTPAVAGVLPVYGYAYGALNSAWFDDLEISQ